MKLMCFQGRKRKQRGKRVENNDIAVLQQLLLQDVGSNLFKNRCPFCGSDYLIDKTFLADCWGCDSTLWKRFSKMDTR
jgi:hypothetical protein